MTKIPHLLQDRAAEYITRQGLIASGDHLLTAVSGGPDSVALLHILLGLKEYFNIERITVVHFDHRLRGRDSDADREFVRDLAISTGLDFRCSSDDVRSFARKKKISLEMAARELRHSFFKSVSLELNAQKTALGHTADDQAEEVLLRLLRGTGPAGLAAMPPRTADGIIRPLLFATRSEILEYLQAFNAAYREDLTNLEPFCQRNLLRLKIFPLLREAFHPQIAGTISRYAELAAEEESWWATQVEGIWSNLCVKQTENLAELDLVQLKNLHPALLRRILRYGLQKVRGGLSGIGMVHLEPLLAMISSLKSGKSVHFPGGIEAVQEHAKLIIRRIQSLAPAVEPVSIEGPGIYRFGNLALEISVYNAERTSFSLGSAADFVIMDDAKVKWPLELRLWKPGDRFCPLGMKGAKKLQDFFVDSRVPKDERRRTALLCDSEKICWVAGLRMDDRVKVTAETTNIVEAKLIKLG